MTHRPSIRPEGPADAPAVFEVNRRAFDSPAEADLVEALRAAAVPRISLVADVDAEVIGHVLFTPVTVGHGSSPLHAIALAPMAVLPEFQRRGVGSALVRAGLDSCREIGEPVVFVLGHPNFYPRFGFERAAPKGLHYGLPNADANFFVAELSSGASAGMTGEVVYHPAFDRL